MTERRRRAPHQEIWRRERLRWVWGPSSRRNRVEGRCLETTEKALGAIKKVSQDDRGVSLQKIFEEPGTRPREGMKWVGQPKHLAAAINYSPKATDRRKNKNGQRVGNKEVGQRKRRLLHQKDRRKQIFGV